MSEFVMPLDGWTTKVILPRLRTRTAEPGNMEKAPSLGAEEILAKSRASRFKSLRIRGSDVAFCGSSERSKYKYMSTVDTGGLQG